MFIETYPDLHKPHSKIPCNATINLKKKKLKHFISIPKKRKTFFGAGREE
jgi:hypothetical protein